MKVNPKKTIIICTGSGHPCHCHYAAFDKLVEYGVIRCKMKVGECASDKQKIVNADKQHKSGESIAVIYGINKRQI